MSVIEPEIDEKERKDGSLKHSHVKHVDEVLSTENADSEQKQDSEERQAASKKRKSKKSKDGTNKKVKSVAYTSVEARSLQAWYIGVLSSRWRIYWFLLDSFTGFAVLAIHLDLSFG